MLGVPLNRYGGTGLQLGVMAGEANLIARSDQVGVELRPVDIVAPEQVTPFRYIWLWT